MAKEMTGFRLDSEVIEKLEKMSEVYDLNKTELITKLIEGLYRSYNVITDISDKHTENYKDSVYDILDTQFEIRHN